MYLEQLNTIVFIMETLADLSTEKGTPEERALKFQTISFMLTRLAKQITDDAARATAYQQLS